MIFIKKSKLLRQFPLNINILIIIVSLYFGAVLNYPLIQKIYEISNANISLFIISNLLISSTFVIIFSLLAWPYVFKTILIPLILTSSLTFYASFKYNVMFDYNMIENIFETNTGEAFSYLNVSSVLYFIGFGFIPVLLLLKVKIVYGNVFKGMLFRGALLCSMLVLIGITTTFYYKDYASIFRNNSYLKKMINPADVFNTVKYINKNYLTTPLEYLKLGEDATLTPSSNNKPTLMVLIVGETARSQNINYNGYQRKTNPYTEGMGIISFQNTSSCGTETAISLPCMFSNMNRSDYSKNRAVTQDNALDILTYAGVDVHWIENDGGHKRVAQNENITKIEINRSKNDDLCNKNSCYDEVMLREFPSIINQDTTKNKLIAMHLIGSHGPTYYQRYPKDKTVFTPACNHSDIENCSIEEIVNVYDNTIVYTDYVIAQTITLLKQYQEHYNIALLYVSDHGESLGEKGIYLHGTPYVIAPAEQTKVPWFMWASDEYFSAKGISATCLQQIALNDSISHDNLFHTLLGFYGVETQQRQEILDITAHCKL